MSALNPLSWQNENNLANYPLDNFTDYPSFISDANFIQFDAFVPILKYVLVETSAIKLAIEFDSGIQENIIFNKDSFLEEDKSKFLRIYTSDNSRYLGSLSFGQETLNLWENFIGRKLIYNSSFNKTVVRSIPKNHGVYTFDGLYGAITITKTTADESIFYNTHKFNSLKSNLTFNAVTYHEINASSNALKKINLVKPVNNNITLSSNDLIKITPSTSSTGGLDISLVSGTPSKAFVIPTLIA